MSRRRPLLGHFGRFPGTRPSMWPPTAWPFRSQNAIRATSYLLAYPAFLVVNHCLKLRNMKRSCTKVWNSWPLTIIRIVEIFEIVSQVGVSILIKHSIDLFGSCGCYVHLLFVSLLVLFVFLFWIRFWAFCICLNLFMKSRVGEQFLDYVLCYKHDFWSIFRPKHFGIRAHFSPFLFQLELAANVFGSSRRFPTAIRRSWCLLSAEDLSEEVCFAAAALRSGIRGPVEG